MNGKYKLIVTDLDGTLLKNDKSIAKETVDALRLANQNGVKVAFSTGRPNVNTDYLVDYVGFDIATITMNGARIDCGDRIYEKYMSEESAKSVYEYLTEHCFNFAAMGSKGIYLDTTGHVPYYINTAQSHIPPERRGQFLDVKEHGFGYISIFEIISDKNRPISKYINPDMLGLDDIDTVRFVEGFQDTFMQITVRGVTKGSSLKILCNHLGIDTSEVIAFGDNSNDLDLLKCAGFSVVVGNASSDAKYLADYVTLSNEENGVAAAIHKFVL